MRKQNTFSSGLKLFIFFTLVCGVLYTFLITGFAELTFTQKANGNIIEVNGTKYGSVHLGQNFEKPEHLWGRAMIQDFSTFTDKNGKPLMYASPSNKSPVSDEYIQTVKERVSKIKAFHPEKVGVKIPAELVTVSASGLDPHISVDAAMYQAERIAKYNNMSIEEVKEIIDSCTHNKFLGIFGEKTVNVLQVNLKLEGIL